jgi:hypothetical protein
MDDNRACFKTVRIGVFLSVDKVEGITAKANKDRGALIR